MLASFVYLASVAALVSGQASGGGPMSAMSSAGVVNVGNGSQSSESVFYTTIYEYDDCSAAVETLVTVTNGVTVTYCPLCAEGGPWATPADRLPAVNTVYTTIYTTEYAALCPTGPIIKTYTVTETCAGAIPTWTAGPGYIPQGFAETTTVCTVCGPHPITTTLTVPCSSSRAAPAATAAPLVPAVAGPANAHATGLATVGSGSGSGTATRHESGVAYCPGPQCTATNVGSSTHGPVTSSLLPYRGAATPMSASFDLVLMAASSCIVAFFAAVLCL